MFRSKDAGLASSILALRIAAKMTRTGTIFCGVHPFAHPLQRPWPMWYRLPVFLPDARKYLSIPEQWCARRTRFTFSRSIRMPDFSQLAAFLSAGGVMHLNALNKPAAVLACGTTGVRGCTGIAPLIANHKSQITNHKSRLRRLVWSAALPDRAVVCPGCVRPRCRQTSQK